MKRFSTLAILALSAALGCSDGGGGGPTDGNPPPAAVIVLAGDVQSATAAAPLGDPLRVKVADVNGRGVQNHEVGFVVLSGGGSVDPATVRTDAEGVAETRWTLGTMAGDTQRVEARVTDRGALVARATFRAVARAGRPVTVGAYGPERFTGPAGEPLADSIAVWVRDAHGNGVPGVEVAWQPLDGMGGTLHPNPSRTGPDGVARTSWWLAARAGVERVRASISDGAGGLVHSGTFQGVGVVGPPDAMARVKADVPLRGAAGAALADSVGVYVNDAGGNPIPGVTVEWTVTGGGGSASPTTSQTSADGIAWMRWTLGPSAGPQGLRAAAGALSLNIGATATTPPGSPPRIRNDGAAFAGVQGTDDRVVATGTLWNDGPEVTVWMEYSTSPTLANPSYTTQVKYSSTQTETSPHYATFTHPTADPTPYYYRFTAANPFGITRTPILKYTPPPLQPPPTIPGLRASQSVIGSVTFQWDDEPADAWHFVHKQNSSGGWTDVGYRGARPALNFVSFAYDATFNARETSAGPWRVQRCQRLVRGTACSDWIPVDAIPIVPLAGPTNLQAVRNGTSVTLTWDDNTNYEWKYMVVRDDRGSLTKPSSPEIMDPMLPAGTTTFTDHNTVAGFTHRYVVYAWALHFTADGAAIMHAANRISGPSNEAAVTMPGN